LAKPWICASGRIATVLHIDNAKRQELQLLFSEQEEIQRELAENLNDLELRRKLWDRYKVNGRKIDAIIES